MKSIAATSKKSMRLAVLFVVLSLGSIGGFAGNDVAANVLIPRESVGAPAGGSGSGADATDQVARCARCAVEA